MSIGARASNNVANRITAPIHRSTAYDFNVQLDAQFLGWKGGPDKELLGVKEHEILMARVNRGRRANDRRLSVTSVIPNVDKVTDQLAKSPFASSNLPGSDKAENWKLYFDGRTPQHNNAPAVWPDSAVERALMSQFTYVGVAITPQECFRVDERQMPQGFAATRGGLNTLINTGKDTIRAGQSVHVGLNLDGFRKSDRSGFRGIPSKKNLFTTKVLDQSKHGLSVVNAAAHIHAMLRENGGGTVDECLLRPMVGINLVLPVAANGVNQVTSIVAHLSADPDAQRRAEMEVPPGEPNVRARFRYVFAGGSRPYCTFRSACYNQDGSDAAVWGTVNVEMNRTNNAFVNNRPFYEVDLEPHAAYVGLNNLNVNVQLNPAFNARHFHGLYAHDENDFQLKLQQTAREIMEKSTENGWEPFAFRTHYIYWRNHVQIPAIAAANASLRNIYTLKRCTNAAVAEHLQWALFRTSFNHLAAVPGGGAGDRAADVTTSPEGSVLGQANVPTNWQLAPIYGDNVTGLSHVLNMVQAHPNWVHAGDPGIDVVMDAIEYTLRYIKDQQGYENSTRLGTALSSAEPGKPFDIVLNG